MHEQLSVPVCVERAKTLRLAVPVMFVTNLVAASVLYMALHAKPLASPSLQYLIPAFVAAGTIPAALFLIASQKPAVITMTRALVTIVPIPICGIRFGAESQRNLSEFSCILVGKVRGARGGTRYCIVLHGKDGREDVVFPAPVQPQGALFAHRLGAALGLSVRGPL
jgi:hypothetical protein